MARVRDYHAEYVRRIARFEKKLGRPLLPGENIQAARGHRRGEHLAREIAPGQFTPSSSDRAFVRRQRKRMSLARLPDADYRKGVARFYALSPAAREEVKRIQRENSAYMRRRMREAKRRNEFTDKYGRPADFEVLNAEIDDDDVIDELTMLDIIDEDLTPVFNSELSWLMFYR